MKPGRPRNPNRKIQYSTRLPQEQVKFLRKSKNAARVLERLIKILMEMKAGKITNDYIVRLKNIIDGLLTKY